MTKEQASKQIAEYIQKAEKSIKDAEKLALKYKIDFDWNGPSYGMGGYFIGGEDEEFSREDELDDDYYGWKASSQSC
jgi:hypothetical protein